MKLLYFVIGFLSLFVGLLGILLPILPTTPFLLLSAFCFAKSSKRLHVWFIQTKIYEKHLSSFVTKRAMLLRTKISILAFASTMLLLAIYFMDNLHIRIFLFALMIFKYYYFIFCIKTIQKSEVY